MKSQHHASNDIAIEQRTRPTKLLAALAVAAGLGGFSACAEHVTVPNEIASCPCSGGSVCCASGVCAENQDACTAATRALSESVQGEWTGYLENFQFSTDDSVKISIDVAADGTLSGHVILGMDTPPAPATDGDAVWPPSIDPNMPILPVYMPGFAYAARNIRWEARRLRFDIAQYQAWQPWCALQQSYEIGPDWFSCIPGTGGISNRDPSTGELTCVATGPNGDNPTPVPCFKLTTFCSVAGPCTCDAAACNARTDTFYSFDISLRDGTGDGSTTLTNGNVRLTQTSQ